MSLGPFLPLLGVGILIVGAMLFWAAVQNWMADLIQRASVQLGSATHTLQSALVVLDRVMVTGQRLFVITARAVFRQNSTQESVHVEEVKRVAREKLPQEILTRLEAGETLQYELSVGSMTPRNEPRNDPTTHRLAVRFEE
jgi:hypothetical protein